MLNIMKKSILVLCIVLVIIILEFVIIWIKLNYFQIKSGNEEINSYEDKYILETVMYDYIFNLSSAKENYKEFSKVYTAKSHISEKNIINIIDTYELEYYVFDATILNIIKLSDSQYKCTYSLLNTTEALSDGNDGTDVKTGEVKEGIEYINEIIIDINKEKKGYKVLYNKFDLGGGTYYEK